MKLLILGGTVFLGRHLIEAALSRGHEVTIFNRGLHGKDLYPDIEKLRGSREGDLMALQGKQWDAVIDTNGYVPSIVRNSARFLANTTAHYTFISSISVYAEFSHPGMDETAPVGTITAAQIKAAEQVIPPQQGTPARAYGANYGPLKALCEQAAEEVMPGRVLVIRPGIIVGPYDYSDRFTYWPYRLAQGGEVLAPGRPDSLVQIIDARDLSEWIIHMVETCQTGTYNAVGPEQPITMQELLETCKRVSSVSGSNAHFTWIDEDFLLEAGAIPWSQIPLWLPDKEDMPGHSTISHQKALVAGLTFRPLAQIVRDTLDWALQRPPETQWQAGLTPEDERRFLQAWHQQI
jgi:2'-hydroxyisoflavone reductase